MIPPADLHLGMQNSARPPLSPPARPYRPADAGDVDAVRRQVEGLRRLLGELGHG